MKDSVIAEVADNHYRAARIHLAFIIEQAAQELGLMSYYTDENGNGPTIQESMK